MRRVFGVVVVTLATAVLAAAGADDSNEVLAKRLNAVEVLLERSGLVVTLIGDGVLAPSSIHEAEHWPPRLLIDLPNVTAAVPASTPVHIGPVDTVRVEGHSDGTVATRVILDLTSPTSYHIEGVRDHMENLRVLFPLPGSEPAVLGQAPEPRRGEARLAQRVPWLRARSLRRLGLGFGLVAHAPQHAHATRLVKELSVDTAEAEAFGSPVRPNAYVRAPMVDDVPLAHTLLAVGEVLGAEPVPVRRLGIRSPLALAVTHPTHPLIEILAYDEGVRVRDYAGPYADHITLAYGMAELGRRLEPEAPPVSAAVLQPDAGRYADHITLAYGMAELGRRLEPETSPVPLAAVLQPDSSSVAPDATPSNRSRFILPSVGSPRPKAQLQQAVGGAQGQYTGDPVSMDFQNADLRAVLRTFAEISELNIVIDPQVDGTVDVSLTDVPWDQALDIILRANQLGYDVDGTIVRIAPLAVLSAEAAQRRQLAEEEALSGDLVVLTRTLSYARAANMADLVTPLLSLRGQVQTDERTNTMIITDLQDRLGAAEQLLDTLDRAEPQVEIEARIVQAGRDFARAVGVQWGISGRVAPDLGNTTPLTFPNRGGVSGRLGAQGPEASGGDSRAVDTENAGTAVNLPVPSPTAALGLTLGAVDGSLNLDVVLSAAEDEGQLRLLSHPRVTTQNNVQAEIVQGDQIPIQVVANNTVTVTFEDAALSLRVTPQITAADTVIMQVEIDNDVADFGRSVGGIPPIVTQHASTTVQVANGDTTVIGGIFESQSDSQENRVPGLHRIPLLGWLFQSKSELESTTELLIFLTPRIVR